MKTKAPREESGKNGVDHDHEPEGQRTLSVKLPAGIYDRMEKEAFNNEHIEEMAASWLAQAAIERFHRDEEFAQDDSEAKYPAAHLNSDEFVEGFPEAFSAWRDLKNALAGVLASFANGPSRRGDESDRIACHHTVGEMTGMLKALTTRKKFRKLIGRLHEANRQWNAIEAGHGDPDVTADGFRNHCDAVSQDLYGLV